MTEISMVGITKTFGNTNVLRGIDLDIKSGELMVFIGPSGCGKSTILRVLSGLEDITEGELTFDGARMNEVPPPKRNIAMVFQSYALYPHMTVLQNLSFALRMTSMGKVEIEERVNQAATMLQIAPLLDRYPRQLSGGQRQRVAIGRAIVRKPGIFLFDEPLSNLDASLRVATRLEIAQLHTTLVGTTMIYVTHDQVEAMTLADRICVLRDGLVEQVGTPAELYAQPRTQFVAGFIGSPKMNFLTGDLASRFDSAAVGIRPEHVEIAFEPADISGQLRHVEDLGADRFLFIDIGQQDLIVARQPGQNALPATQTVHLSLARKYIHRFNKDGNRLSDPV